MTRNKTRPLIVVLPSVADALDILRNKSALQGPSYIRADLTLQQREELIALRADLDKFQERGLQKTIKYIRGTPTIVDTIPLTDDSNLYHTDDSQHNSLASALNSSNDHSAASSSTSNPRAALQNYSQRPGGNSQPINKRKRATDDHVKPGRVKRSNSSKPKNL